MSERGYLGSYKKANMATYSNYAPRVPSSLMEDLRLAANRDGVSMNGFIVQAVAEKVMFLRARGMLTELPPDEQLSYLNERAEQGKPGRMFDILSRAGTLNEIRPGDEVPDNWLPGQRNGT